MSQRVRLILAATAFIGWLGYLGYTALMKNRGPVISRVQAAVAMHAIVAEVKVGDDGRPSQFVTIVESLTPGGPEKGTEQFVANLPETQGFDGPKSYLLLLTEDPILRKVRPDGPPLHPFAVVGQQRSPGNDLAGVGRPIIYPWTDALRKQYESLPKKENNARNPPAP